MATRPGLVVCEDHAQWDEFCHDSAEGTPFMQTWFTQVLGQHVVRYFWSENSIPRAALLIHLNAEGRPTRPIFSVHHSLCYAKDLNARDNFGNVSKRFAILEALAAEIDHLYGATVSLCFHPQIIDMRPLAWYNHDGTGATAFNVLVRYTAIRDLSNFTDREGLLKAVRKSRKEEYKKSLKAGISVSAGAEGSEVLDLYHRTFGRHGIEVAAETQIVLQHLLKDLDDTRGFIVAARTAQGSAVAATLVLTDAEHAYSLIIASDPAYRHSGANTACVVEAMMLAKHAGKRWFDFVGANSPKRGDFKLSFRADLTCYFEAELRSL